MHLLISEGERNPNYHHTLSIGERSVHVGCQIVVNALGWGHIDEVRWLAPKFGYLIEHRDVDFPQLSRVLMDEVRMVLRRRCMRKLLGYSLVDTSHWRAEAYFDIQRM